MKLALALVLACTTTARGDVPADDAARATALFEEGRRLADGGQAQAACDRFEASFQLDPQLGTRLNLADCREQQGRLVEAYTLFDAAVAQATAAGKEGRATFARQRLDALNGKLAHVTLRVAAQPGLVVSLGAHVLAAAQWSVAQPAAPGTVVVDASAPGHKPVHVERAAAAGAELTIEIPVLDPLEVPSVSSPTHRFPVALATTIAGGTLLAGSFALGLHARARWQSATHAGNAASVSSAQHEADIATGVAIAGAVAVAVGIVLYTRAPRGVVVTPTTDGSAVGLVVGGPF